MPLVDKGGDEIAPWFVGDYKSWLQTTATTKTSKAELVTGTCLIVVSNIDLAIVLHVMYVETHHMSKAVRHHQTVGSISNDIIYVAFEYSKLFVALCQYAACCGVYLLVGDAGTSDTDSFEVGVEDNLVYGFLTFVEMPSNRNGTGVGNCNNSTVQYSSAV